MHLAAIIEDRNSYTDMLVAVLCTPIIPNASRYFHKCLNIQNHILCDRYHTSPVIQAALSVRALNTGTGLNLFKCVAFTALTPMTFAFLDTCPEASSCYKRRQIGRPPSSWQLNTVEALDLFRGLDQLSAAMEDKWLMLLNGSKKADRWRGRGKSWGGGQRGEGNHIRGLVTVINGRIRLLATRTLSQPHRLKHSTFL